MNILKKLTKLQSYFAVVLILAVVYQQWIWGLFALASVIADKVFELLLQRKEEERKEAEDETRIMIAEVNDNIGKVQATLMLKIKEVEERQTDIIDNIRGLQRKVKEQRDDII